MANLKDTIVLGNLTVTGKINGAIDNSGGSGVSVINANPTLAWSTQSTVATIGGTAITLTMPANPNTTGKFVKCSYSNTGWADGPANLSETWYKENSFMGSASTTDFAWQNIINIRHRGGGGEGDNSSYGMQIRSSLTSSNDRLYYRHQVNDNWYDWISVANLSDCKNPTDYYWANVKISSNSSTTTVPTFAYIRINDDSKVYTGPNTWGTADVDTYYYSRGIKASNYTYSFPRRSGYFIVNQSPNDSNVAIGAKVAITEGTTTSYYDTVASGTQSIAIGAGCEATGQYSVAMGYLSKASNTDSMAFGRGVVNSTSGRAQFGTTSYKIKLYSAGHSSYSDIRNKTDVEVIDSALDFINDLTPITYRWNPRSRYAPEEVENFDSLERPSDEQHLQNDRAVRNRELIEKYGGSSKYYDIEEHQKGTLKDKERQAGLSAQDIYDKLQKHYGTEEYANILSYGINENATLIDVNKASTPEGCTIETELSVDYEMIIPFLIRAIQEQQQQIDALKEEMRNEKSST